MSLWAAFGCVAAGVCASEAEGPKVVEVRFEPRAQPLPQAMLSRRVSVDIGKPLDPRAVRATILNLFDSGRFSNIEAETEPHGDGVALVLRTELNRFVGDIQVIGVEAPPEPNQLINALKLRLGQIYTDQAVASAMQNLRRILRDNGFASPRIEVDSIEDPETAQVNITFRVEAAERAGIGKVVVTGDSSLSEADVRRIAKWESDKELSDQRLDRGLERLRDRLHEDGRWQAEVALTGRLHEPDSDTFTFVVDVRQGPRVTVRLEGAEFSPKRLQRLLPIFEEGVVDDDLLAEGARNLREYLQTQGYFDAQVEYRRERTLPGSQDEVGILYLIDRGARQKLVSVRVQGARFFDQETFRERMTLRPSDRQVRRGRYSESLLERDVATIRDLYLRNGFLDVAITSRVLRDFGGKSDEIGVLIQIEEGVPTVIETLEVRGMEQFPLKIGEFQLASAPNQPFSETSVANDRDFILGEYFNAGFHDAQFDWTTMPGEADHNVAVAYTIREGERLYVQRPLITGILHTEPDLVAEQILLQPDQPLSQDLMFESQRRLYDLGVFTKVEVALQNPEGGDRVKNVLFDLEEARRWTIRFGGGAEFARIGGGRTDLTTPVGEATFAPRLTAEATRINFRGLGHTLNFRTRLSTLQQRALATYENPRWTGSEKWKMIASGLYDTSRNIRTFVANRLEGAFQLEHRLSKPSTALYRYIYRRTSLQDVKISAASIPLSSRPIRAALISGTYIQDRRDDPTDATRGVFNTLDLGFASGAWGSQPDFFRFLGQNSTYHGLTRKIVLARTTRLGILSPWGDHDVLLEQPTNFLSAPDPRLPLSERFYSGGAASHRGFPINQSGPRDPNTGFPIGGGAEFLNSIELRFPLMGENIGGVLFHDAGNVYSKADAISFRTEQPMSTKPDGTREFGFDYLVQAVGFGLRYRTPIGPVRVDFGYALNPPRFIGFAGTTQQLLAGDGPFREQRISNFQFHFSLGQTF